MASVRVLIVDDEDINRQYLRFCLEAAGFQIDEAADGADAWRVLQLRPDDFDAVLLDWRMPEMDGLEVLARIKDDPRLDQIPVIMQTALDGEQDVIEAIDAGVYYYLTKPYDSDVLISVVRSATNDFAHRRRMESDLEKRTGAIRLLTEGTFRLRTLREADALAVLLASGLPRSSTVAMGLSELLINAIEHGNLALDYANKTDLMASGEWDRVVARRLVEPGYRDRWVSVEVRRGAADVSFTITDDGDGFDWHQFQELNMGRLFESHGRGIAMARKLAFRSLCYQGRGNVVVAVAAAEETGNVPGARPSLRLGEGVDPAVAARLRAMPGIDFLRPIGPDAALTVAPAGAAVVSEGAVILVGDANAVSAADRADILVPPSPDVAEAVCRALLVPDSLGIGRPDERRLAPALAEFLDGLAPDPVSLAGNGLTVAAWSAACTGVSGDIWGGRRLPDGRLFLFISDMTGHGPLAGVNAAHLHRLLDVLDDDAVGDPAALLCRLDADLHRRLAIGDYAAMLAGTVDPVAGVFTYAAAGIPNPVVVDGAAVTAGSGRGLPAGASGNFPYQARQLNVPPGAALVLFTDGLFHAAADGAQGEVGWSRVVAALAGADRDVAARLAALVAAAPNPCADDFTAVCVTRAS